MRFGFRFRKAGKIGSATSEQESVLERLERGEVTPEQAAEQLGGKVRTLELSIGDDPAAQDEPKAPVQQAAEAQSESPEDAEARELVERIAREVDAESRG